MVRISISKQSSSSLKRHHTNTTTRTWAAYSNSPSMQVNTIEDVPSVEFMHLVFTRMPGESCCRWLRSLLLCLCDVFLVLLNSLVYWFCTGALGLVLFQSLTWAGLCPALSCAPCPTPDWVALVLSREPRLMFMHILYYSYQSIFLYTCHFAFCFFTGFSLQIILPINE